MDIGQIFVDFYDDQKLKENKVTPEKLKLLNDFGQKIDPIIKEYNGKAFVRLSTRSPKDVALRRPKTKKFMNKKLKN